MIVVQTLQPLNVLKRRESDRRPAANVHLAGVHSGKWRHTEVVGNRLTPGRVLGSFSPGAFLTVRFSMISKWRGKLEEAVRK